MDKLLFNSIWICLVLLPYALLFFKRNEGLGFRLLFVTMAEISLWAILMCFFFFYRNAAFTSVLYVYSIFSGMAVILNLALIIGIGVLRKLKG